MNVEIGDKLSVRGVLGTKHYGIYVGTHGGGLFGVVHNDKYRGQVMHVELDEFLAGRPVVVESRVQGGRRERAAVAYRALSLRGRQYDLLNFNCEHLATLAQTGTAESGQVKAIVVLGLALLGALALRDAA